MGTLHVGGAVQGVQCRGIVEGYGSEEVQCKDACRGTIRKGTMHRDSAGGSVEGAV